MGAAVRPLAQDFIVVDESPAPKSIPLYTPSVLVLPNGRILASNERSGAWRNAGNDWAFLRSSDDGGLTWTERATARITHGRFFLAGESVYYLGQQGDLQIMRSDDNGSTWSPQTALSSGQYWHQSACNTLHRDGYVYIVMERALYNDIGGPADYAPVLMRAREGDDLTLRESWTFAEDELCFADIIPGFRENQISLPHFGVPFFSQALPDGNTLASGRNMQPIGWYETNIAHISNPEHPLYDPSGKTIHLLMRCHTGGVGYAAFAQVVENDDGSMRTSLVQSPNGNPVLFLPMPCGQMRFHLLQDEKSGLYWLLGSQTTDSMIRICKMPANRYGLPNNERQRLVLHFSSDLIHWQFAGLVDKTDAPNSSRHYASMDIDGDDLLILSRSGDAQAATAHNGNLITLHRIKNFRNLAY